MRTVLPVTILFLSIAYPSSAHACRCVPQTPEEHFAAADLVFRGTVVSTLAREFEVHAFVDWIEAWKGELPTDTLVRVVTTDSSAACGFPFREGDDLVIFARVDEDAAARIRTHTCTLTGQVTPTEMIERVGPPTAVNPLHVEFQRGDVNADGRVDIADPIASLQYQFSGAPEPPCRETLDFEDDGAIGIADPIAELNFLFTGGPPPASPFGECGKDRDLSLFDCARFPPCPSQRDRHEVVRIERVGDDVEIEVFSTRPFPARALFPILCIGTRSTFRSRGGPNGGPNTLIFTFPREAFDAIEGAQLVTVQHGDQCLEDLDWQRLYWDLWVFGTMEF